MVKTILICILCALIGFVCGTCCKHEESNQKTADWLIALYDKCKLENEEGLRRERLSEELLGVKLGTSSPYLIYKEK